MECFERNQGMSSVRLGRRIVTVFALAASTLTSSFVVAAISKAATDANTRGAANPDLSTKPSCQGDTGGITLPAGFAINA